MENKFRIWTFKRPIWDYRRPCVASLSVWGSVCDRNLCDQCSLPLNGNLNGIIWQLRWLSWMGSYGNTSSSLPLNLYPWISLGILIFVLRLRENGVPPKLVFCVILLSKINDFGGPLRETKNWVLEASLAPKGPPLARLAPKGDQNLIPPRPLAPRGINIWSHSPSGKSFDPTAAPQAPGGIKVWSRRPTPLHRPPATRNYLNLLSQVTWISDLIGHCHMYVFLRDIRNRPTVYGR